MSKLILQENVTLKRPILIVAFAGWTDGGRSATIAAQHLIDSWSAQKIGEIDVDDFFDFTTVRPWVNLGENGERRLTWPSFKLYAHQDGGSNLDALVLLGPEPALHWRAFANEVVDLAHAFDVSMVITLGAHLARVSHRDAVPVSGWAWPKDLNDRLDAVNVERITYEGPTGILTVLADALADARIPVASLWAALPGFLGPTPNPKGALALAQRLDQAFALNLSLTDLSKASADFEQQIDQAIKRSHAMPGVALFHSEDSDQQTSESAPPTTEDESKSTAVELPTAEEIVRDVEQFLRQERRS